MNKNDYNFTVPDHICFFGLLYIWFVTQARTHTPAELAFNVLLNISAYGTFTF